MNTFVVYLSAILVPTSITFGLSALGLDPGILGGFLIGLIGSSVMLSYGMAYIEKKKASL